MLSCVMSLFRWPTGKCRRFPYRARQSERTCVFARGENVGVFFSCFQCTYAVGFEIQCLGQHGWYVSIIYAHTNDATVFWHTWDSGDSSRKGPHCRAGAAESYRWSCCRIINVVGKPMCLGATLDAASFIFCETHFCTFGGRCGVEHFVVVPEIEFLII